MKIMQDIASYQLHAIPGAIRQTADIQSVSHIDSMFFYMINETYLWFTSKLELLKIKNFKSE